MGFQKKYSSVDVGSNAIRQVIIEINSDESIPSRWKVLKKFRSPLRLGTDVFKYKKLTPETISKLVTIFKKIAQLNQKYKVNQNFITATSALRDCENKKEVLKIIFQKTGQKINIISGDQEALYIREAIMQSKLMHFRNVLMIDIGGGSLELSALKNLDLLLAQSMPLGVVRLLHGQKSEGLEWKKTAQNHLKKYKKNLEKIDFDFAIGTGGNFDALSKLKIQLLKKVPDTNLSIEEISQIYSIWKKLTPTKKLILDIRKDRIDVLDIAIPLIILILNYFHIKKLKIPQTGLKEGVILTQILQS